MTVKELITDDIIPLQVSDTVLHAVHRLEDEMLEQLPVNDGRYYEGLIHIRDIQNHEDPQLHLSQVSNFFSRISVSAEQHLFDLLKIYYEQHPALFPVVDELNDYTGFVSLQSLLDALARLTGVTAQGGLIVLEISKNDYLLSELIQVIEENNARVLCYLSRPHQDTTIMEVALKLDTEEIGPLLQAFARLNYRVTASWPREDTYHEGLQDRFDALMNYLNI